MRQAAAPAAIDQVKGRRTNYSFCRREKGRILQTIYVPLPVVDVHSDFASGKTARFMSSTKVNEMAAFRPRSHSDNTAYARLAQPHADQPRQCRTTTQWNGIAAFHEATNYRAATDAYLQICLPLMRVPAPHPDSPAAGLYGKPPCNHSTQKAPAEGVRKGKILKLKVVPKLTNHMQASFRRPYQALI